MVCTSLSSQSQSSASATPSLPPGTGGMDTHFQLDGQWLDTPMGIAHYLEHKMFDTPDGGNALQTPLRHRRFPNAFTSTAITGYHFECTDQFWGKT